MELFNGSMTRWLGECINIPLVLTQVALLILSVSVQDYMN